MNCPKCRTEFTGTFCPNCGTRVENAKNQKIRLRKNYNGTVYVILSILIDGFLLGIADFYAGYIKMGLVKCGLTIIGITLLIVTGSFVFGAFACVSVLISVFEMLNVVKKGYVLENGEGVALVRPLDLIYDRVGTDNMLISRFGQTIRRPGKTR